MDPLFDFELSLEMVAVDCQFHPGGIGVVVEIVDVDVLEVVLLEILHELMAVPVLFNQLVIFVFVVFVSDFDLLRHLKYVF